MAHGRAEDVEWPGEGRNRLMCQDPKHKEADRGASRGCFVLHGICLTFDVVVSWKLFLIVS